MAKQKEAKTNAMRAFDAAKLPHLVHTFETDGALSGVEVAQLLNQDPDMVFKTLVTEGKSGNHFVFMIPVAAELDLRKAAQSVGEKNIHMIKSRELLPLTGYVHGGCSPVGMKKQFVTVVDETAQLFDQIIFSAGRIGAQIQCAPDVLESLVPLSYADLTA